ncbi:3D domain-containing protein [Patescibacteria group bacterium]|nr:3D domain-containing protein [Patescibacteria group bacterium]
MRKCYTNSDSKNYTLITIAILAIISIILNLSAPENTIIAKSNKNIKTNNNIQGDACELERKAVFQDTSFLKLKKQTENNNLEIEVPKKEGRVLAVQIETDTTSKTPTVRKKQVLVTAFSSTVDQTDSTPFITASGTRVHDGTVAANFLPFGTKVRFPSLYGDKIFIVEDRMKSDYKVDIWFPTRQEAINFGAKRLEMEIL